MTGERFDLMDDVIEFSKDRPTASRADTLLRFNGGAALQFARVNF